MSEKQRIGVLKVTIKGYSYTELIAVLPKKKQTQMKKQAKREVMQSLTKGDKKKICVAYKTQTNTNRLVKRMRNNENNASNAVMNRYLAKRKRF